MYDTVIIGKGPAGISAAIYLKRAGLNVLIIGKDGGSLEKAGQIENYYGFDRPINGKELIEKGIAQAENLGITIITAEVTAVDYFGGISVKTPTDTYKAKTLLFAIGKKKKTVNIEGVKEFAGRGVSYCAVCDGFFYKNKKVAVIGSGKLALSEAAYLKNIAGEVTVFTNGEETEEGGFNTVKGKITKIYGEESVKGVMTETNSYSADGVFIALGTAGAEEFAYKIGLETENGNITVDKNYATNIQGIYAAGDCTGGFLQVSKAVSDGANAANSIMKYIKSAKQS